MYSCTVQFFDVLLFLLRSHIDVDSFLHTFLVTLKYFATISLELGSGVSKYYLVHHTFECFYSLNFIIIMGILLRTCVVRQIWVKWIGGCGICFRPRMKTNYKGMFHPTSWLPENLEYKYVPDLAVT